MSDEDIPGIYPFEAKAKVEAKWGWLKNIIKKEYDSDIFPPNVNKTKKIGIKKQRHFQIKCDGKGHMGLKELLGTDERMKRLNKWKEKGWIDDEAIQ